MAPEQPLDRLVRCYWVLEGPAVAEPQPDRILPDGCAEIVFHYADEFERLDSATGRALTQHRCAVVGQMDRWLDVRPLGRVGVFGVRLRPEGAASLLRVPAGDLAGRSLALTDVLGALGRYLEERVLGAKDTAGRIAAVESALRARAAARHPPPAVRRAVGTCLRAGGVVSVRDLAAQAGVTRRHLERLFDREVGLAPKVFARLVRFRAALSDLQGAPGGSAAAIAVQRGYADQAHLSREFRAFAGSPPSAFLSREAGVAAPFNG